MSRKTQALLFAGVALLALLVLASGLGSVDLFPADRPFTLEDLAAWLWQRLWLRLLEGMTLEPSMLPGGRGFVVALQVAVGFALIGFPLALLFLLLAPELRRRVLRELTRFALFIAALYTIAQLRFMLFNHDAASGPAALTGNEALPEMPDFLEFAPGGSRSWLVLGISAVLGLLVAGWGVTVILRFLAQRRAPPSPLEQLAREARETLAALRDGEDFTDAVTRCYRQMTQVLARERKLQRDAAVTAREFESYLTEKGLPAAPVHTLTRLFEAVRYGAVPPGPAEVDQALHSLAAIIAACEAQP